MTVTDWIEQYKKQSDSRFPTFKKAFELLNERGGKNIVETGCIRMVNDWGAGMSTFLFGEYAKLFGGHVWTVDISEPNMDVCRLVTKDFSEFIDYTVSDSILFLYAFPQPIDFLYLDSVDCPIECEANDPELLHAQNHQLNEIITIMPKLNENTVVLLDDNGFKHGGKTKMTKSYLRMLKWKEIMEGQQSLWSR